MGTSLPFRAIFSQGKFLFGFIFVTGAKIFQPHTNFHGSAQNKEFCYSFIYFAIIAIHAYSLRCKNTTAVCRHFFLYFLVWLILIRELYDIDDFAEMRYFWALSLPYLLMLISWYEYYFHLLYTVKYWLRHLFIISAFFIFTSQERQIYTFIAPQCSFFAYDKIIFSYRMQRLRFIGKVVLYRCA